MTGTYGPVRCSHGSTLFASTDRNQRLRSRGIRSNDLDHLGWARCGTKAPVLDGTVKEIVENVGGGL
jgi:hypothetical protein